MIGLLGLENGVRAVSARVAKLNGWGLENFSKMTFKNEGEPQESAENRTAPRGAKILHQSSLLGLKEGAESKGRFGF